MGWQYVNAEASGLLFLPGCFQALRECSGGLAAAPPVALPSRDPCWEGALRLGRNLLILKYVGLGSVNQVKKYKKSLLEL